MRNTYPGGLARTDFVREAVDVSGVTHEDGGRDFLLSGGADGDRGVRVALVTVTTTAVDIVEDLATLDKNSISGTSKRE